MTLNQPLGAVDFFLMPGKTFEQRGAKAQSQQIEQLIANHPPQRYRGDHQRETKQPLMCGHPA
ncbi:hypothetical protein D3C81_2086470 [compost metagenome]